MPRNFMELSGMCGLFQVSRFWAAKIKAAGKEDF